MALEWKIDSDWEDGDRWHLCDQGQVAGRVVKLPCTPPYRGGLDGIASGKDMVFTSMKEAAQYVVAEYKSWQAKQAIGIAAK